MCRQSLCTKWSEYLSICHVSAGATTILLFAWCLCAYFTHKSSLCVNSHRLLQPIHLEAKLSAFNKSCHSAAQFGFCIYFFFQTAIFYVCRVIFTERLTWIGFWLLLHSGRLFNCSLCIHFLTTIWLKLQTQPAEYRALLPVKNMTHIMSVSLRIWFHFDNLFRFTFGRSKITFFEGKNRHTISLSLHGLAPKLNKHIICQN